MSTSWCLSKMSSAAPIRCIGYHAEEFMESTLSVWEIPPESARKVGHPAPFPVELAERVIKLYSYTSDVILDPFAGSGTTCLAAALSGRRYVGYDISLEYCQLAEARIREALGPEGEQLRLPLD